LEKNILKLRAFEMTLILFYVEDIKKYVNTLIELADKPFGISELKRVKTRENKNSKLNIKKAMKIFVDRGILTEEDRKEYVRLVNYRNNIGHEIYTLTGDVGPYSSLSHISKYDSSAVDKAFALREKVQNHSIKGFTHSITLDPLKFDAAEKTYRLEIERLKKRFNAGIVKYNKVVDEVNAVINSIPKDVVKMVFSTGPQHFTNNGSLSKKGAFCITRLYSEGATPLAVSYLMRISLRAAKRWQRRTESLDDSMLA